MVAHEIRENLLTFLKQGIRFDGRKLTEYRQISVQTGVSKAAEGSALVQIGDTQVIVGVKLQVDKPYPDSPEDGTLMVNAELLPLSSADFEPGPPGELAIELARVVDRGIRESKTIDTKKLCVTKKEKAWSVMIDVCSINAAGNLIDASALGALLALRDAKFPKYDKETGKVMYEEHTKESLPLKGEPLAVTVYKIDSYHLIDPLPEEEAAADGRLTITVTADGQICSLQKNGKASMTVEEIDSMIGLAIEKSKELRKFLK